MKKLVLGFIAVAALIISGCGGEAELLNAPEIIGVVAYEDSVKLTWEADTAIENHADFNGYNVYYATDDSALLLEDGENLNPVNTTPVIANTFTITGLSVDTIYFFQVRTLNTSDKVGGPHATVPVVQISPRPEFVIGQLHLEISTSDTMETGCALLFSTGEILDEVGGEFPNADVFADKYGTPDTAQIVTASARPNGRSTLVIKLDTTYTWDSWDFTDVDFGTSDRADVNADDLLLCQTEEGNYVKVLIQTVDLTNNYIDLKYAYQNIPDYPYLSQ